MKVQMILDPILKHKTIYWENNDILLAKKNDDFAVLMMFKIHMLNISTCQKIKQKTQQQQSDQTFSTCYPGASTYSSLNYQLDLTAPIMVT